MLSGARGRNLVLRRHQAQGPRAAAAACSPVTGPPRPVGRDLVVQPGPLQRLPGRRAVALGAGDVTGNKTPRCQPGTLSTEADLSLQRLDGGVEVADRGGAPPLPPADRPGPSRDGDRSAYQRRMIWSAVPVSTSRKGTPITTLRRAAASPVAAVTPPTSRFERASIPRGLQPAPHVRPCNQLRWHPVDLLLTPGPAHRRDPRQPSSRRDPTHHRPGLPRPAGTSASSVRQSARALGTFLPDSSDRMCVVLCTRGFHDSVTPQPVYEALCRLGHGGLPTLGPHRRASECGAPRARDRAPPPDRRTTPTVACSRTPTSSSAAPRERYDRYVAAVRREWAHLPDADFAAGRWRSLRRPARQTAPLPDLSAQRSTGAAMPANVEAELVGLERLSRSSGGAGVGCDQWGLRTPAGSPDVSVVPPAISAPKRQGLSRLRRRSPPR